MGSLGPYAVVICDDRPLVRAGIASAVAAEPSLAVVAQSIDLTTAVAAVADHPKAILIIRDRILNDGVVQGIDALPAAGVVACLDRMDDDWLRPVGDRHVRALIRRAGPPDDVRQAALAVGRGAGFIATDLALPLLDVARRGGLVAKGDRSAGVERLTERERQVLRSLSQGAANGEIAATLRITEKTVKFHVSNLLAKTGLRSRAQLIAWVHTGPSAQAGS